MVEAEPTWKLKITRVIKSPCSVFCTVFYSINGVEERLGLRFDGGKQRFLDKTGIPAVDDSLEKIGELLPQIIEGMVAKDTQITNCARCSADHPVSFKPFLRPSGEYTHWAMCPVTNEPILMKQVPVNSFKKS